MPKARSRTTEHIAYAQRERLAFVEVRTYFCGSVTRAQIEERFRIRPAASARDLIAYRELAPGNLRYNAALRCYQPTPDFAPVFSHSPAHVLSWLRSGTFRENLRSLKAELERARVKSEQKHYPGGTDVAKALATIDQQMAIRDSYEFIEAVVAKKNDWLDLAEDTHDVLSFYKTQVTTWVRLLDTLNAVSDNHDALVKDPQAASALAKLEAIRANPAPYGQVNQIEALVTALDKANEALAAERREKALNSISAKLAEASQALDAAQATPELRNKVLKPLQDLKTQVASLSSIPKIMFLQGRGADLLDEVMDKLAQVEKDRTPISPQAAGKEDGDIPFPMAPLPPGVKPIRVVRAADICSKTYLESEADVEGFVAQLKAELLATVRAGKKARVQ